MVSSRLSSAVEQRFCKAKVISSNLLAGILVYLFFSIFFDENNKINPTKAIIGKNLISRIYSAKEDKGLNIQ